MANYLLTQSWQIALLTVIVGLISHALRHRSAHIRYLLWLIVLAKCLVPPILTLPLPVLPERPVSEILLNTTLSGPPVDRAVGSGINMMHRRPLEIAKPSRVRIARPSAKELVVLVWLAGVILFFMGIGTRTVHYNIWLGRRRRSLPPALSQAYWELCIGYKFKKPPKIWLTKDINQPFVWGLLRGSVYLPDDFANQNVPQYYRTILAHELSHVARFDAAVNIFQVIAQALYWFHPFVWGANRKIRQEREKCCDEMAIAQLQASPEHYTGAVVEVLAAARRSAHPTPSLAIVGSLRDIEERIKTMLRPGRKFYKRPSLTIVLGILLAALLTVPTAPVLTARAQTEAVLKQKGKRYESLFEASGAGALDEVKRLIAEGAKVNAETNRGETPLHIAAANSHKDIIELLIANGADVDANKPGYTPLTWAIWQLDYDSEKDIVEALVTHGADVNFKPKNDDPAIYYSVWNEDVELAELLFAHGARLNVKSSGWTVLRHAAAAGNQELVEFFVNKGADAPEFHLAAFLGDLKLVKSFIEKGMDVDTKDEFGWPPLFWAASTGKEDVVEFLIGKGANINTNIDDSRTLLHQAAQSGERNLAKLLISRGVDVNAKNQDGWTPLHHAAGKGQKVIVDLLIENGADINVRNWTGRTPLHLACQIGYKEIVDLLIDKGADINSKNNSGETALFRAAGRGQKDIVEIFIAKGADLNARNKNGRTPLFVAAINGQNDIVEFLITKGADVNVSNNAGVTPLDRAEEIGQTKIVELLLKHGAEKGSPTLFGAVISDDIEQVKRLIAEGANVNAKWGDINTKEEEEKTASWHAEDTSLYYAVDSGKMESVKLLVEAGADVNAGQWPPLYMAVEENNIAMAEYLIEHGAKIDDGSGWTALQEAPYANTSSLEMIKLLITKGGDVNAGPYTALHGAVEKNRLDMIELLLEKGADINAIGKRGMTPLCLAARYCTSKTIRLLITRGANPNIADEGGFLPLHWAACHADKNGLDLLLATANYADTIYLAACKGDLSRVKSVIESGTGVNTKDKGGWTPLHWAGLADSPEVAEFLISNGADVNARAGKGFTTLRTARSLPVIELLISRGADINAQDTDLGLTKLHMVCGSGRADIAELLIARGADVNAKPARGGMYGRTPLHFAAIFGHRDIAELLVSKGADIHAVCPWRGSHRQTALHLAARTGQVEVVEYLLAEGFDANVQDSNGQTALDLAKKQNHTEIVELLKKHGAK
ncbi:ankyrin repeat domain-containing protein [Planctomycetota bacterium]